VGILEAGRVIPASGWQKITTHNSSRHQFQGAFMNIIKTRRVPGMAGCNLLLAGILASGPALAQTVVPPVHNPGNNRILQAFGAEALVRVRYTVTAEGTTDDLVITEYLGNAFTHNMARDTVQGWTFEPGTVDGEAIPFYNQEHLFAMRFDPEAPPMPGRGGPGGRRGGPPAEEADPDAPPPDLTRLLNLPLALSEDVRESFEEITAMVAAKEYEDALKEINRVLRVRAATLFDYSLMHDLACTVNMATNALYEALNSCTNATLSVLDNAGGRHYLADPLVLQNSLRKRLLLEMSLRQHANAVATYDALMALDMLPADDSLHERIEESRTALASPDPLPLLAGIVEDSWEYHPSRRIFTVTNVDGRLNRIDAHCQRRNLELEYQDGVDWSLPESLGDCRLEFEGRDGTTFTVYEFSE
jgi:hypothetical protein